MIQLLRSSLATEIVRISGVSPNKALSAAAKNKIKLKNVVRVSPVCFEAEIFSRDEIGIRRLLKDNYKIEVLGKRGTAYKIKRILKRYALVSGLVISIVALMVLSRRVFFINVYGSEDKLIYDAVKNAKIVDWHSLAEKNIDSAVNAVMQVEGVIWASVEIKGCYANVFVKQEKLPEYSLADGNIVAKKDCVIKNLIVYSGTPVVKNGDVVFAGQTLVENYEIRGEEQVTTKASAKAIAQTWYIQTEAIPLKQAKIAFTGREKIKTEIDLFGKNFILQDSDNEIFESSIEHRKEIFSSFLPIKITRTVARETENIVEEIDAKKTIRQAEIDLSEKIAFEMPKDAKINDKSVEVVYGDDCVFVSVFVSAIEDVAIYQ